MKLADYYTDNKLGVSFELFPPKTEKGDKALHSNVEKLMEFSPNYITCTYGAGGSTRTKTLDIVSAVKATHGVPVASHLTCVGSSVDELRGYLTEAIDRGIDYIVALRGDPPQGETNFVPDPNGLRYANELVDLIQAEFSQLGIAVAGYPETHLEAPNADIDLENLKRKVDAGADVIMTQLFFDNADYYNFRERCEKAGIQIPIVPGIFPVASLPQIKRIANMCGAKVPQSLLDELSQKPEDAVWHSEVGVQHASRQVEDLISNGVPGLHFYVLNKSEATISIMKNAGLAKV
ncbi:MAG: methylenetetrahydrofolate reductase [NAD(P)H] [Blastopirellula sp.]|nr:MAG: methylenetetrahydrofolate reductase [NAD(P)H] [Blastopirellula sp.]